MKVKNAGFLFVLFISTFILITPAFADGIIIPEPPICIQEPCPSEPFPISQLEIRYHHVDVIIEDQIAITRVDQVFYNPNDWVVEGDYVFPIPLDAAVTNLSLWIDGEPVQGKVLSAEEARQVYESIVWTLQDPALLEYADRGAVQARIFPIGPKGERRIQLEYMQVLTAEQGLVRYVYPLNTEKFSTQPLDDVHINVDIRTSQPIRAVYSPSHPVAISREDNFHVTAGYEAYDVRQDQDFDLYYSIGKSEAFHLLSFRDPTDLFDANGFFLALLAPRPDAALSPVPKDVILILDRSGSMEGEKFIQAQEAIKYILQHLNPEDRFNLISFSTGLDTFARDLRETPEIDEAMSWVARQSAVGSTDINRALLEAADMADLGRPTYLIFLTDGLPTEGVLDSDQILNNFSESASQNMRLFAFGVGYDVDTFLLDSLAQDHHGTSTYVRPGEPLGEILSSFYAKVSTPVLMDLTLDFGEFAAYDMYPNPLPDLFAGSQIVVVGRYSESGIADITLTGTINGIAQNFTFPNQIFVDDSDTSTSQSFIPRLWATRKIGYLLNQIRLQGPEQELIDQIVSLSVRFGIVTPYTSYLVTEEMPLGIAEQERIANEAYNELKSAPAAPTFGQDAVEQAAGEGLLRDADTVSIAQSEQEDFVHNLGSRTYVFSKNTWVDTTFDPDRMETEKVAFLSTEYFDLAASDPQLAGAFSLGIHVIALSNGIAYEVVDANTAVTEITIPPTEKNTSPTEAITTWTPEILPGNAPKLPTISDLPASDAASLPCISGMLPFVVISLLSLVITRKL